MNVSRDYTIPGAVVLAIAALIWSADHVDLAGGRGETGYHTGGGDSEYIAHESAGSTVTSLNQSRGITAQTVILAPPVVTPATNLQGNAAGLSIASGGGAGIANTPLSDTDVRKIAEAVWNTPLNNHVSGNYTIATGLTMGIIDTGAAEAVGKDYLELRKGARFGRYDLVGTTLIMISSSNGTQSRTIIDLDGRRAYVRPWDGEAPRGPVTYQIFGMAQ